MKLISVLKKYKVAVGRKIKSGNLSIEYKAKLCSRKVNSTSLILSV